MGEFRFLHLTQGPLSGSKQVWHRSFGFGAIDPRLPGAFDAPPDTTSGQVEVTTSSPTFHRATLLSSVSRGLTASLVGALLIWLAAFTEFADYQEVKVEHQLLNPSDLDKDIEVPLFTFLAAILGPEEYLCLHWKLCPIYASMAAAPSTSLSSGVPLQEFRRDLPPGWAPGLADYSLNQYLQKLKLWYRIYDGPDEAVGPLVAGRLQGQAQKLALNLRLIRPDGNFDVGDNALVRLSVDQVIDPMDGVTILQHAIPSGVQALAHQLREAFGMSDQEHTTSALNAFFEFRRGKLSLQEYASEWDLRYDEAQTRAGLDINPVAKTYLWFRNSGLPNKFIEDVKLQIQGDMSRFAEAKRLALRLSQRGENSTFSTDLYGTVDEPYEDYHTTDDWSSWHEPWQETWYADEWADDDLYTWYDAEEGYYDEEWSTYHGESPSSEWYSPEEYDMSAQDAYDPPPQAASSTDQNEDAYYGKGGKGGSGGCHVCGSKWHHAAQCPVKTGSRELGKSKGKGKFKSRPPWRSKGKGKWSSGKGYKGKKGKGKSKGYSHDSQGYMVDRDAMAYFRQQPGNGLRVEDPSTPPRPVNPSSSLKMTPPDNTELLAWRGSAPLEEAGHDPSSGETYAEVPPPKNLTFATYVNNTSVEHSCYHHSVKGKKRRSLLIDPGAAAGLVGSETLRDLIESCYPEDGKNMVTWSESTATITGISGCPDKALGRVHLRLPFRGLKAVYEADVIGNEGSLCPALCGNPALCAMKASLHSSWFDNQDGLLVTWDTQSQNTPVMYAFRVLLTDSGHYLLPLDEDTSLKSQDLQICHFIKELSEVAHRQWPDHAYTFWQSAVRTAIPEQKRSCLERTYHSSPFEVEPKDPRATAQQTSCSTTPEAEIKNHDSLTSCSTTVEEKIKDQGIDTSCSASPEDEIHDHSVNTSCSTSPEAEIHDHSMNTSCSTIPEETFNDHGKDTSCSTTTDVFLADALIDLPLYTGDLLPNYLTPEEQKKLTKDYKAMPEEFYTHTNRRMVTPSSFPKWFSEAKKRKTKWHVWEWCSGSSRLSLTCCLAGLIVGFPVDFRYGWDIGNPEHQKMLDMALSTFEPEILMASPRCKFWSISASRRDRHLLLQDREAERPALIYMQQTMSYQVSSGRAYVLEQPWTSAMWSESVMVVSVLLAAFIINWLQTNADFQQDLKEEAITTASSHRIGKLSGGTPDVRRTRGMNSSWRIIAAHVEQPDQGAYLCVKAKADPDPARGLDGDEICIDMAVQERYEPTGKDLKCQYSYRFWARFQVEGYNNHQERGLGLTVAEGRSTIFDVPSRILKVNAAVPTDSLEYFVEHFAQFNINGKHPQHLVILSDIKVCYHKNWNEEMDMCIACRAGSQDCMSDFLLTAYMGESSARCEKETRMDGEQGVTRMDGVQGDVDDEEENRTQVLDGEIGKTTLCVGAADRKCRGEDVAEGRRQVAARAHVAVRVRCAWARAADVPGKLEWDDLIEAFDKYEVTEDSEGNEVLEAVESWDSSEHREQTIFVELVNEKVEGEFDEEWLVWVEARVTFKNELDSKCEEMPYSKRIFQLDPPGQIFYEGMERFLAWDPTSESLQVGRSGVPLGGELPNRLLAERVQVTNGGVSVMISFPDQVNANHLVCQLFMEGLVTVGCGWWSENTTAWNGFNEAGEQVNAHSTMEEDKGEALPGVSHRFIICRTWTLADFELMYASFCRMNSMEMERVTESALQERDDLGYKKFWAMLPCQINVLFRRFVML
ncbi:1-alkyl-2-acetylglycerophosphocholine esterase [Durusdinium trenchii]|uniref:1-alkyl-2-acetylglycerophosphocholine esterase n=1 Tax=Durusdinium trenchii TaxID=1381693 RepID=A0ABP0SLE8_9DINO